jgi:hypothetical protein
MTLCPNPGDGRFTATLPAGQGEIRVLNLFGSQVFHSRVSNREISVDLTDQPAGLYFVIFTSGNEATTQKLVIR